MSPDRYPCGTLRRRSFLAAGAAALPLLTGRLVSAQDPKGAAKPQAAPGALGIPGPYPGRVVEVRHPGMATFDPKDFDLKIKGGGVRRFAQPIKTALDRGMCALTDAPAPTDAWRRFFEPGDVVGIKMNPVGTPLANSSTELMLAVIDGLKAAGVKTKDIVVFERYKTMFVDAKMHEGIPDGIAWGGLSPIDDPTQLEISFPGNDPVAGYDRDEFIDLELVHEGFDPKDDRTRRSHLGSLVTKRCNKLVLLPVLKDHGSAGITGALKNMSHGLVNNVARSHSTAETNACNQFIPQVVTHPIIRQKCVLQVMDGTIGVFQKGPFGANPEFIWPANALFLSTDPVAMDSVEWRLIDEKRKAMKLPPVAATGKAVADPFGTEGFDVRQPQHVSLCGNLGLGVYEKWSPEKGWAKIDHRIVNVV